MPTENNRLDPFGRSVPRSNHQTRMLHAPSWTFWKIKVATLQWIAGWIARLGSKVIPTDACHVLWSYIFWNATQNTQKHDWVAPSLGSSLRPDQGVFSGTAQPTCSGWSQYDGNCLCVKEFCMQTRVSLMLASGKQKCSEGSAETHYKLDWAWFKIRSKIIARSHETLPDLSLELCRIMWYMLESLPPDPQIYNDNNISTRLVLTADKLLRAVRNILSLVTRKLQPYK